MKKRQSRLMKSYIPSQIIPLDIDIKGKQQFNEIPTRFMFKSMVTGECGLLGQTVPLPVEPEQLYVTDCVQILLHLIVVKHVTTQAQAWSRGSVEQMLVRVCFCKPVSLSFFLS